MKRRRGGWKRPIRPRVESHVKRFIKKKQKQRCGKCGEKSDYLEIHHIIPFAKGGDNKKKNLIALCKQCHIDADKHNLVSGNDYMFMNWHKHGRYLRRGGKKNE